MNRTSAQTHLSKTAVLMFLLVAAVAVVLSAPFIGANLLSMKDVFDLQSGSVDAKIFWQMRLPRVFIAFLAGATFALCGMVFQALFRNPLVDPSTLGVSAGASFGATVYIWLGLSFAVLGVSGISLFAFIGALASIYIVWSLSRIRYGSSISKMLLAGIVVSFFFVSLIMLIQYLSNINQSFRITRWLMGGLFVYGYEPLWNVLFFSLAGFAVIWYFTHELNLLTTGEELAISRGVDVAVLINVLFLLISLIIGCMVAVCGPIAFVGIIVPHICRLLIGSDHRFLTPATFLFGGLFLTVCDTFARTVVAPAEIPVGVITAILGGPFFLWLLKDRFID